MNALSGHIEGDEHVIAVRVYYEDTDAAAIVYYANYLKFMERARSDMLRAVGIDQRAAKEAGEGVYAVAEVNIRYRRPARLGDDLLVVSTVESVRAASVTIHQRVMRGSETLADACVTAAFLDPQDRPKRQPRAWVEKFRNISET